MFVIVTGSPEKRNVEARIRMLVLVTGSRENRNIGACDWIAKE